MRQFKLMGFLLAGLSFMGSCQKSETGPIPSYLVIDSVGIEVGPEQGNSSHEIAAVEVYADQQFLGNFLLPARIPILKEGEVQLIINPVVRINGASSQYNTFRTLASADTVLRLVASKETALEPMFHFRSNAQIDWVEDFEDKSSTLVPLSIQKGDTAFMAKEWIRGQESWVYKAVFEDSDTTKNLDLGSFKSFIGWPKDGTAIFLEFDIRCDIPVQLALKRKALGTSSYVPYLLISKTNGSWKRFYCNLVYEVSGQSPDAEFQLLFSADKLFSETGIKGFAIDNIRLSYLN
jgi:hypothetical protein